MIDLDSTRSIYTLFLACCAGSLHVLEEVVSVTCLVPGEMEDVFVTCLISGEMEDVSITCLVSGETENGSGKCSVLCEASGAVKSISASS